MKEVIIIISGIFAVLGLIRFLFANGMKEMAKTSDQPGAMNVIKIEFLKSFAFGTIAIIGTVLSITL